MMLPAQTILTTLLPLTMVALVACPLMAAPDKAKVKELVEQLGNEDYPTRIKAAKDLKSMGEPIAKLLMEYRGDENPEVRSLVRSILDQVVRDNNEMAWIDPKHEGDKKYFSSTKANSVKLTFRNFLDKPVLIFWIETDGSRKPWRGLLKPGDSAICDRSYPGHYWLITDAEKKAIGLYYIEPGMKDPVLAVRPMDVMEK